MFDQVDMLCGFENEYDIKFGDIFWLRYCDINVLFYVCRTSLKQVCIYELAKKKIKYNGKTVEVLCKGLPATKKPMVVCEDNCWTKSNFWVDIIDYETISIPINTDTPLYKKAWEKGCYPAIGYFNAIKLIKEQEKGILKFYFDL